jgi:hypothetical protein
MNLPSFPNAKMFSAGINVLYGVLVARQGDLMDNM